MDVEKTVNEYSRSAVRWGADIGRSYPDIWGNQVRRELEVRELVSRRVKAETGLETTDKSIRWAGISAALLPFVVSFSLSFINVILATFMWFVVLILDLVIVTSWFKSIDGKRKNALTQLSGIAAVEAFRVLDGRRKAAASHEPGSSYVRGKFQPKGAMPGAQPLGVSHQGAEELCAQWMRFFGEGDAKTTRFVADGGIDIESLHYVAQVKNYSGSVGVAAIRELAGVAAIDGRKPIFFTSGTYASGAIDFANKSNTALFVYAASAGTLESANSLALRMLTEGF